MGHDGTVFTRTVVAANAITNPAPHVKRWHKLVVPILTMEDIRTMALRVLAEPGLLAP